MRNYLSSMILCVLLEFSRRAPSVRPNVLLSYALLDNDFPHFIGKFRSLMRSLILDSGVFSIQKDGSKFSADELLQQFKTFTAYSVGNFDLIFNFDRHFGLDSYDANLEYQIELEAAGIPVVPVVHNIYHGDVEKIIARGLPAHKTVAIGQCEGRTVLDNVRPAVMALYDAGARIHFFGSNELNIMANLPIWSCDATSWSQYTGYGIVLYWNPKSDKFDKAEKIHFPKFLDAKTPCSGQYYGTYGYLRDFEDYLDTNLGLTVSDLLGENGELYRSVANMLYYCLLEKTIAEYQKSLGFEVPE